jgi:hypothetical protein
MVVFVFAWRGSGLRNALLAVAASIPLQWSFANAQDLPWVLAFTGVAFSQLRRGNHLLAGLAFSVCLNKYHLFLLIPLVLISRERVRIALGLGAGALAILVLSFAVAGPRWPGDYLSLLFRSRLHIEGLYSPNLFGLMSSLGLHWIWMGMAASLIAGLVLLVSMRADMGI